MISLIVAYDKNKLIGKDGNMPWYIKGELKRFKNLTENNIVIMGRKTYESLKKPLDNRVNIILSTNPDFVVKNSFVFDNLDKAITFCKKEFPDKNIFIIGGANLYRQILDIVDIMYITEINYEFNGDTFFPIFDESKFNKEINEVYPGPPEYVYTTYTRKKCKI